MSINDVMYVICESHSINVQLKNYCLHKLEFDLEMNKTISNIEIS